MKQLSNMKKNCFSKEGRLQEGSQLRNGDTPGGVLQKGAKGFSEWAEPQKKLCIIPHSHVHI